MESANNLAQITNVNAEEAGDIVGSATSFVQNNIRNIITIVILIGAVFFAGYYLLRITVGTIRPGMDIQIGSPDLVEGLKNMSEDDLDNLLDTLEKENIRYEDNLRLEKYKEKYEDIADELKKLLLYKTYGEISAIKKNKDGDVEVGSFIEKVQSIANTEKVIDNLLNSNVGGGGTGNDTSGF